MWVMIFLVWFFGSLKSSDMAMVLIFGCIAQVCIFGLQKQYDLDRLKTVGRSSEVIESLSEKILEKKYD